MNIQIDKQINRQIEIDRQIDTIDIYELFKYFFKKINELKRPIVL